VIDTCAENRIKI